MLLILNILVVKVVDKCGKTAYKLDLPSSAKIHHVFHVSQLKLRVGDHVVSTQLPFFAQDVLIKEPDKILERRMVKRQGRAATKVLVKWVNEEETEATWEFLFDLLKKFPSFQP
ncbi:hypothetical protein V5N11_021720 [Cardamine amara subsp. amara]|uniref:Chromo domain-containing protein n=1 Tax=Cardamine amara subsp. amara TaxID=228776 RepID=A0ABD1BRY3_CARAN